MSGTPFARVLAFAVANVALLSTSAFASQGPGIAPGTASPPLQLAMAVLVYGGSAAVIAFGVLRGVRKH